ncbi:uncharacterized protein EDB91DRAFT_701978 [Suillus paluster]|uniref:uncharacterized protein n=1 Tax=Suillus paluster TaxID=48578 RepID=UPI001B863E8B|nr:uncharacterized protein EDB91DRAFT_701978 [Suillus paluster]KAG1731973.1 hypothetical protein EDB91DRAFT_701978 [Suillus paluster]
MLPWTLVISKTILPINFILRSRCPPLQTFSGWIFLILPATQNGESIQRLSKMAHSTFMRYTNFHRLLKLWLTLLVQFTSSMEHSQSFPSFHTRIGEFQYIPDMESFYTSDSADSEHHPYVLSMPTIPRIALEDFSDDSITSVKKTHDFNITAVGASVRQGDFLQLPDGSWPYVSPSRSSPSPQGTRRRAVDVVKYTDALSAPACRLPAFEVAHEYSPEPRNEIEDETEGSNILLEFIEDVSRCQPSVLTSHSDGVLVKSFPMYPGLEPSVTVHFHGKHRRSRAASYQITPGALTERGDLIEIQPFSGSPKDARWAPKNGMMVIKVYIPSTDDIWATYVPTSVTLSTFTCIWLSKLSLHLRFSGSVLDTPEYYFDSDEVFQHWVNRRIRHGRNLPIVGHLDYAVPSFPLLPQEA